MHPDFNGEWFCGPGGFFWGMPFGGLLHLVFWAVLIYLVFKIVRSLTAGNHPNVDQSIGRSSALSILEERYASGEINQEEFLRKKKDLGE